MKNSEAKRHYSIDAQQREKHKLDNFKVDVHRSHIFKNKALKKKPSFEDLKKVNVVEETVQRYTDKNIENFSKLSEMLAEAQSDILVIFEKGLEKTGGKTKLWEIFTYLNNKI